jgi:hypothetical protein
MPNYIFEKNAFTKFIEKHLKDDTVVLVSSDFDDSEAQRIESHIGLKDYFEVKAKVLADVFKEKDAGEFDDKFKYVVVFASSEDFTEKALEKIRK